MSDDLSVREALRWKILYDRSRDYSIAELLSAFGRKGIDAERTASDAADESGQSMAHQIARLDVLFAWCDLQQLGFKDEAGFATLFRQAKTLCNRFGWAMPELRCTTNDLTDPIVRSDKVEVIRQWARGKIAEMEGSNLHATHSPDFHSVNWFGTRYEFTGQQAACVRVLWEAWEKGCPAVGAATILEIAGSDSERLPLVFRDHPAWGTMIVPGERKGNYQLNAPAAE